MKAIRGLFLALCLAFLPGSPSYACSGPVRKGTEAEKLQQAFDEAAVVFFAKVRKSTRTTQYEPFERTIEDAQLVVLEVFKGQLVAGQPVMLRNDLSSSCSLNLRNDPTWIEIIAYVGDETRAPEMSDTWLIFAQGEEPWGLHTGSLSMPMNLAERELTLLRQLLGQKPAPARPEPVRK